MATVRSEAEVRDALGPIAADPDLELLVLFGSRATGRAHSRSDVDVGLLCRGAADLDAWFLKLAPLFGSERLDLVDLGRADPILALQVARTGRLLFERPAGRFHAFQALASRRYVDTHKLRLAQRRAIHVFLEREGLA